MILFLDTSGSKCKVWLDDELFVWDAGRGLAKGILRFLEECLEKHSSSWEDLTGLVFMKGPGSFTGLRIGAVVMNTIADSENLPIVGEVGDDWREKAEQRLSAGKNDKIVLPEYGAEANITALKK